MKKMIIATATLALMCGSAFAQTSTGPAGQSDNMQKPGMNKMEKGSMEKGTTGMNNGMSNGSTMTKGGMQPDASGQGGSGPGSDQGGTRAAPGTMK